jgi:hypothetical protein
MAVAAILSDTVHRVVELVQEDGVIGSSSQNKNCWGFSQTKTKNRG